MNALISGTYAFNEEEMFTKFTTYSNSNWSNKNRALYLCYLTVRASTAFDALYYYYNNSTTDPNAQAKLNTLRRIVQACYDMLVFVDNSYSQMVIEHSDNNSYKWGSPSATDHTGTGTVYHDFTTTWHGNTYDIDLPNFYLIQDRLMMFTARGYAALMLRKDAEVNPGGFYPNPSAVISQMNADILNINIKLTQTPYPNVGTCTNKTGLLAFHTNKSGGYIESLGYLNWVMVWSNPFFASLARLPITDTAYYNYYNDPSIAKWVNDVTDKTTPYLGEWAYSDTHYLGYASQKNSTDGSSVNIFQSCAIYFYYYNTTNPQDEKQDYIRDKCAWYIQSRKLNYYPGMLEFGNSYVFLLLYYNNPLRQLPPSASIPQNYAQGTWSNEEFGILRKQINVRDDLVNTPSMYITFKNSMNCWHNHADQTAFSFFYRGKQFLIDSGYNNTYAGSSEFTHTWTQSPYAHNMVIVNPLDSVYPSHPEEMELNHDYHDWLNFIIANPSLSYPYNQVMFGFGNNPTSSNPNKFSYRPTCIYESVASTSDDQLYESSSYQTYFAKNPNNDILQTHLEYDYKNNNVSQNNPFYVNLTRSYIRDGDIFFVYDDLKSYLNSSPDTPVSKTYWNLLQTGVWTNNPSSLNGSNGSYSLYKGEYPNTDCVDLASGSTLVTTYNVDNSSSAYQLPMDNLLKERIGNNQSYGPLINGRHRGEEYTRIRVSTTGINPKFLTVIAPRESFNGAQLITQTINTPAGHYGVMINSKSHTITDPITLCKTFSGCSDGTNITASYSTDSLTTDGKFYLVTRPTAASPTSAVVDNSLVLMNGNFIDVNSTPVYHCYSSGILSMNASYLNNVLDVEFHATSAIHPRFKISRSGINPGQFSTNLSYSSVLPPAPINSMANTYPQSEPQNILDKLAYDNNYFYVNYSIADLVTEGVLDSTLFIYSGTYYDTDVPALLQFKGPNITLGDDWFIAQGRVLKILGNSIVKLNEAFNINVEGELDIIGSLDNTCNLSSLNTSHYWDGIYVSSGGKLNLEYCNIDKSHDIFVYGTINSHNVTIDHSCWGLRLCSIRHYQIENTTISNGEYSGVLFNNCVRNAGNNSFSGNLIINNLYGIALYDSSPLIEYSIISNNEKAGIICTFNSNPVVLGSSVYASFVHNMQNIPGFYNPESPEVILYEDCFPAIHRNDIIFGDGYSLLLFDVTPDPFSGLDCQDNYWGTTDARIIQQSFFPADWNVVFQPFLTQSVQNNPNGNGIITDYFMTAINCEKTGDITLARSIYKSIIENYPTYSKAKAAASRLVCIADTDEEIRLAKNYLNGKYVQYPSTTMANAAYLDSLLCERLLKNYQSAIDGYVDKLQYCSTYMDSILTTLDILYTYLEAEANNQKSAISVGLCMGVPLTSVKQAREMEETMLNTVFDRPIIGEQTYHVPDIITTANNYPNPFNPTTTISFSTPKTSKCELIIYNIKGQEVKRLVSGTKNRGIYKIVWNSDDNNGKKVTSGVYFYRLNIDGHVSTKKMVLMK